MKCFVIPSLTLLIILIAVAATPIKDVYPGQEYDVWHDNFIRRFYGPWSILRKADGDYVNYADYGARIQDYKPSSKDIPAEEPSIDEGPNVDFQSNYNNGPPDFGSQTGYDRGQVNLAAFDTDIRTDVASQNDGDDGRTADAQDYVNAGQATDEQSNSDDRDQDGVQENHDAEGNVQWTAV